MNILEQIVAILLGTVLTYLIGYFWYSPMLFGDIWVRAARLNPKEMPTDITNSAFLEVLGRFIRCFAFLMLCNSLDNQNFQQIFQLAILIVVGFVAPMAISRVAWEMKSWDYFLIQVSEQCVCQLVLGACNYYILKKQ